VSAIEIQPQAVGGEIQSLSPAQFARRLSDMKLKLELTRQFFSEVMVKDMDFGVIPGTNGKPSLLKPGAESLLEFYAYAGVIKEQQEKKDYDTGFYDITVIIQILDKATGRIVAEGVGSANVYEARYRYRWVYKNEIPVGTDVAGLKTRKFTSKKNGQEYTQYRLENDDLFSLWNTVLKMAKKRALVDGALQATRSSGIFTQDLEDMEEWMEGETAAAQTGATAEGGTAGQAQTKAPVRTPPPPPKVTKPAAVQGKSQDQGQKAEASQPVAGKVDWTAFWSKMRSMNVSKDQVHTEARSFFDLPELKSLTDVKDLTQDLLDEFATYLGTIFPPPPEQG